MCITSILYCTNKKLQYDNSQKINLFRQFWDSPKPESLWSLFIYDPYWMSHKEFTLDLICTLINNDSGSFFPTIFLKNWCLLPSKGVVWGKLSSVTIKLWGFARVLKIESFSLQTQIANITLKLLKILLKNKSKYKREFANLWIPICNLQNKTQTEAC